MTDTMAAEKLSAKQKRDQKHRKDRYQKDPEFRARLRENCRQWRLRHREQTNRNRRDKHLRLTYGMMPGDFEKLWAEQGEVCALCLRPTRSGHGWRLVIDHNHDTGKVRGILHDNCNKAIGLLLDDPLILERGASYLRRP